jgi:hypothetical protein
MTFCDGLSCCDDEGGKKKMKDSRTEDCLLSKLVDMTKLRESYPDAVTLAELPVEHAQAAGQYVPCDQGAVG